MVLSDGIVGITVSALFESEVLHFGGVALLESANNLEEILEMINLKEKKICKKKT